MSPHPLIHLLCNNELARTSYVYSLRTTTIQSFSHATLKARLIMTVNAHGSEAYHGMTAVVLHTIPALFHCNSMAIPFIIA